jgi:hypothetical protein
MILPMNATASINEWFGCVGDKVSLDGKVTRINQFEHAYGVCHFIMLEELFHGRLQTIKICQ